MLNLTKVLELTEEQKRIIRDFGVLTEAHWKQRETKLRKAIRSTLMDMQNNFCVYCGCPTHGEEDVEHIAHKADYPQFLFTPQNLAYSCKICNQTFKGQTDVVRLLSTDYDACQFNIVHPYLDDVDHYFDTSKLQIKIRSNLTPQEYEKADTTYILLHWEDPAVVLRRAGAFAIQKYSEEHGTTLVQMLLDDTLVYKPGML